jgi:hypothetical protein
MRNFILIQTVSGDWSKRPQDAVMTGVVEMRASGSRYLRDLVLPAEVPPRTCPLRRPTRWASRRHPSCLAGLERSCQALGNGGCSRSITAGKNPAATA